MSRINVIKGVIECNEDLTSYFDQIITLPDDIQKKMLQASGEVIAEEERNTAKSMLSVNSGRYTDVNKGIAKNIKVGKMKKNRGDNWYHTDVIFRGTQHGVRRAEIAFIQEYGALHMAKGSLNGKAWVQHPRPFIQTAINNASGEAVAAAEKIFFDDFIDKY
jgi:hypothetical protein